MTVAAAIPGAGYLQAKCTQCGGQPPLNLVAPVRCPYCGGVDTLAPELLERILPMRRRLAARAQGLRQFADSQQIFSAKHRRRVAGYMPFLLFWQALVAGIFLGTAGEMVTQGRGVADLLALRGPALSGDEPLAWWLLFSASLWFALSFVLPTFSFFRTGRLLVQAQAIAPACEGEPPRCRVCLSILPAQGTVRRCPACGADHLVSGDGWQPRQDSIDAAIARAMEMERVVVHERIASSENVLGAAFLVALLGLIGSPLVGGVLSVLFAPSPWLFALPALLLAGMIALYAHHWRAASAMLRSVQVAEKG
jgi:hypothetical protein